MTKQLFSDLNDLATEQVVGGFKTAKIEVTYNFDNLDDPSTLDVDESTIATSVASVSWNGDWNGGKKGKAKITDGLSNNVYNDSFSDGTITYWDEFGASWTGDTTGFTKNS